MPSKSAKPRSARPKPRSASKSTTRARKRAGATPDEPKADEPKPSAATPTAFGAANAPGKLPGVVVGDVPRARRHVVGSEHATTASGAAHPSGGEDKNAAEGERFQSLVGPPESASPTASMDNAQRAATSGDEKAVWDALPAGTVIESLGPFHGWRATGPGMHRPSGIGATPLDAVKNIGVPLIRDEELPPEQQSAARKAQVAKETAAPVKAEAETADAQEG